MIIVIVTGIIIVTSFKFIIHFMDEPIWVSVSLKNNPEFLNLLFKKL